MKKWMLYSVSNIQLKKEILILSDFSNTSKQFSAVKIIEKFENFEKSEKFGQNSKNYGAGKPTEKGAKWYCICSLNSIALRARYLNKIQ